MKLRWLVLALAALGVCQGAGAQSLPTYWRLADPDAKVLMGLDWRQVRDSPVTAELRKQIEQTAGAGEGALVSMLFSQVDRVFLSLGEVPGSAQAKGAVALTGEFDLVALRRFLAAQGGKKGLWRGVEVWESGKAADNATIAVVSPQVLAFGDRVSLRAAVSHYAVGGASSIGSDLFHRAAALAEGNAFWIAGTIPPEPKSQPSAVGMSGGLAQMMATIESFDIGVRVAGDLRLDVNFYATSDKAAAGLATGLQALAQLAANNPANAALARAVQQLEMGTEGNLLHFSARWTQAEMAEMFRPAPPQPQAKPVRPQQQARALPELPVLPDSPLTATRHAGGTDDAARRAAGTPPVPQPAATTPATPLRVKIYNPDDDHVRELELRRE
jgi:hypothetical protein